MERYTPDVRRLRFKKYRLDHIQAGAELSVKDQLATMRARYAVACAEIDEALLQDNFENVHRWAQIRMIELSEGSQGRGGHRSDVSIVFNNQDLWGIENRAQLAEEMKKHISGVRSRMNHWEISTLKELGIHVDEDDARSDRKSA